MTTVALHLSVPVAHYELFYPIAVLNPWKDDACRADLLSQRYHSGYGKDISLELTIDYRSTQTLVQIRNSEPSEKKGKGTDSALRRCQGLRKGEGLSIINQTPPEGPFLVHAIISCTTLPCTSVRRNSRPPYSYVSLVWSRPNKCSMVACRS